MCCISLYVSTLIAGVLCILQGIGGLVWNIPVLNSITWNDTDLMTTLSINPYDTDNIFEIYGSAVVFALLNVQLILLSLFLIYGNVALKSHWINVWCVLVSFRSLMEIIYGIYFFTTSEMKNQNNGSDTYYKMGLLCSGIYYFWPLTNFIFCIIVNGRSTQINRRNRSLLALTRTTGESGRPPAYSAINNPTVQEENERNADYICGWFDVRLLDAANDPYM